MSRTEVRSVSRSGEAAELPIPDYDALPLGDLQSRLRTLGATQLTGVLDYERQHANRAAVLTAGDARLRELQAGAEPSGGPRLRGGPRRPRPAARRRPVAAPTA